MLADLGEVDAPQVWSTFDAIVAQLHRLPPRADAFEAVAFDENVFAYALARSRSIPLLFKGNDFSQTDIEPALAPLP